MVHKNTLHRMRQITQAAAALLTIAMLAAGCIAWGGTADEVDLAAIESIAVETAEFTSEAASYNSGTDENSTVASIAADISSDPEKQAVASPATQLVSEVGDTEPHVFEESKDSQDPDASSFVMETAGEPPHLSRGSDGASLEHRSVANGGGRKPGQWMAMEDYTHAVAARADLNSQQLRLAQSR